MKARVLQADKNKLLLSLQSKKMRDREADSLKRCADEPDPHWELGVEGGARPHPTPLPSLSIPC